MSANTRKHSSKMRMEEGRLGAELDSTYSQVRARVRVFNQCLRLHAAQRGLPLSTHWLHHNHRDHTHRPGNQLQALVEAEVECAERTVKPRARAWLAVMRQPVRAMMVLACVAACSRGVGLQHRRTHRRGGGGGTGVTAGRRG